MVSVKGERARDWFCFCSSFLHLLFKGCSLLPTNCLWHGAGEFICETLSFCGLGPLHPMGEEQDPVHWIKDLKKSLRKFSYNLEVYFVNKSSLIIASKPFCLTSKHFHTSPKSHFWSTGEERPVKGSHHYPSPLAYLGSPGGCSQFSELITGKITQEEWT